MDAWRELIHEEPTEVLRIIEQAAYQHEDDLEGLGGLAAGPLDDLLTEHGEAIVDQVEELARQEKKH